MAAQDEINGLRRLFEAVNKQSASNAQSVTKLLQEQTHQKNCHQTTKQIAERALQMCDQLAKRLDELERKVKQLDQTNAV